MKITTHRHVAIVTSEGKVGQKWVRKQRRHK